MFVSYRTWKELLETEGTNEAQTTENNETNVPTENITELNNAVRTSLKEHHYGGVLLFGENFRDAEQTVKLIADIQETNKSGGGLPLLVAADQEGGSVARISFGTTGVGNMALAATRDPANAKSMASIYGEELKLLGLNTDFAPVVDVNNNPHNPVIGVRSFFDSPEMVSEYGITYMEGLHSAGTIATLKHFPGHGNTDTDSHTGFPCIMSSRILTDILRKDMGFEGVVVSDALEMVAIADHFKMEDVLCMTINAGVNMLIVPSANDREGIKNLDDMTDMAVQLAKEGKIDEARIDSSVKRILALKEKYGLLSLTDFTVTDEALERAVKGVGSAENRETALNIAEKAVTLVKNDGVIPIKADEDKNFLILFADSCASRVGNGELVEQELLSKGLIKKESQINVMVNDKENGDLCEEEAVKADYCVLVYRTYNANCLDPETDDGFSSAVFDRIITKRHEEDKKSVLISCQLPYDAARFSEADAILISYNSAVMQEILPESDEGSAYAPNLKEALISCFAGGDITGQLPVNIPMLDENYKITDEVLYERGWSK